MFCDVGDVAVIVVLLDCCVTTHELHRNIKSRDERVKEVEYKLERVCQLV